MSGEEIPTFDGKASTTLGDVRENLLEEHTKALEHVKK